MIYYKLSSRQLAALESGEGLRLAIPITSWAPIDGDNQELRQWFLDSVPQIPSVQLGEVTIGFVWVHLLNRGGGERSLSMTVGEIVDAKNAPNLPCYTVKVAIAVIGKGGIGMDARRHYLTRWPGGEVINARADK